VSELIEQELSYRQQLARQLRTQYAEGQWRRQGGGQPGHGPRL